MHYMINEPHPLEWRTMARSSQVNSVVKIKMARRDSPAGHFNEISFTPSCSNGNFSFDVRLHAITNKKKKRGKKQISQLITKIRNFHHSSSDCKKFLGEFLSVQPTRNTKNALVFLLLVEWIRRLHTTPPFGHSCDPRCLIKMPFHPLEFSAETHFVSLNRNARSCTIFRVMLCRCRSHCVVVSLFYAFFNCRATSFASSSLGRSEPKKKNFNVKLSSWTHCTGEMRRMQGMGTGEGEFTCIRRAKKKLFRFQN